MPYAYHRLVYLVAFAYTKDSLVAEEIAINAMASAFRLSRQRQGDNELKLCLIRITLSEARAYLHRHSLPDLEKCPEEIGDLVVAQSITACQPIPRGDIRNGAPCGTLMRAIDELSARAAVTLILRDVFHLATLEIAGLIGESQQKVRAWLAYGRIALCLKLAKSESDCDLAGEASLAATY
jgi:DNA-directed RNA polymerase specialized sigma24 family protein